MPQRTVRCLAGIMTVGILLISGCACSGTPTAGISATEVHKGSLSAVRDETIGSVSTTVTTASDELRMLFCCGVCAKIITNPDVIIEVQNIIENAPKQSAPYEARYGGRLFVQIKGANQKPLSLAFVGDSVLVNSTERYVIEEDLMLTLEQYYETLPEPETTREQVLDSDW